MEKNNIKKVVIIIVAILFLIIIALVSSKFLNFSGENMNNESLENKNENIVDKSLETGLENVKIQVEEEATWKDSEKNYSTIQVTIKNESDKSIKDWKFVMQLDTDIEFSQMWNGNWKKEEENIIATSVEYNSEILPGNEINLGGTITYKGSLKILSYELYSDNIEVETENENINLNYEERELKEYSKIQIEKDSDLKSHGMLKLDGQNIVDENGENFQIQGVSTHSISAFPEYINSNVFKFIKNTLNCNTIRLCVYTIEEEGYTTDLFPKIDEGIELATEQGLYVILDWHILKDADPNINIEASKEFFSRMVERYKDYENIIYEICNEPNGATTWDSVRNYALEIIPIIRENCSNLIIIGTPNYCKDLKDTVSNPITEYDNLLYSFHFYASSHKQSMREVLDSAYKESLPVIVSEYGLSEYTGTGSIDEEEADNWIDYLRERNIGYICWSFCNKDESSALLKPETSNIDELTEENLSQAGIWIKNKYNE